MESTHCLATEGTNWAAARPGGTRLLMSAFSTTHKQSKAAPARSPVSAAVTHQQEHKYDNTQSTVVNLRNVILILLFYRINVINNKHINYIVVKLSSHIRTISLCYIYPTIIIKYQS